MKFLLLFYIIHNNVKTPENSSVRNLSILRQRKLETLFEDAAVDFTKVSYNYICLISRRGCGLSFKPISL